MLSLLAVALVSPVAQAADNPIQVGARGRYMSVPDAFLDPYVYDEPSDPRPEIRAWAAGLELTLVNPQTQWTFYAERVSVLLDAGYWDDVEAQEDHFDGEWIEPSDNFGLVVVGANAGKDIPITNPESDVWLDFSVSGGLGIGVVTGDLTRWRGGANFVTDPVVDTGCLPNSYAPDRAQQCGDDGQIKIPPVAPMIDLNLGFTVHFTENAYLRLEGGLHDMLFGGGAVGGRF